MIRHLFSRPWIASALGLALLVTSACKVNPPPKQTGEQPATPVKSDSVHTNELNWIVTRMQNPPDTFHYSFTHASTGVDEEGDFSPQTIQGFYKSKVRPKPYVFHAERSDAAAWRNASTELEGVIGMGMLVEFIDSGSWMVSEGKETVNGYDAVKYSIDSSRGTTPEDVFGRKELGPGGFEKGTVWLLPDGCPVKLILDTAVGRKGGSVEQDHWEEAMVKK